MASMWCGHVTTSPGAWCNWCLKLREPQENEWKALGVQECPGRKSEKNRPPQRANLPWQFGFAMFWHKKHQETILALYIITRSTAQGGGGSFKNRKPIGRVGCCESRMAARIH